MFLLAVTLSVVGQMLVIYFPPLQMVFQTEALTLTGMYMWTVMKLQRKSTVPWPATVKVEVTAIPLQYMVSCHDMSCHDQQNTCVVSWPTEHMCGVMTNRTHVWCHDQQNTCVVSWPTEHMFTLAAFPEHHDILFQFSLSSVFSSLISVLLLA